MFPKAIGRRSSCALAVLSRLSHASQTHQLQLCPWCSKTFNALPLDLIALSEEIQKNYARSAWRSGVEEWGFSDERELQGWKGTCIRITCQHLTYGADQHCHTLLGCNLRQQQLQQGEHLKKKCKFWAPTWHKELGWASEAG